MRLVRYIIYIYDIYIYIYIYIYYKYNEFCLILEEAEENEKQNKGGNQLNGM